jgi:hypothetical protein
MTFKEIGSVLAALVTKVTGMEAKVAALEPKATNLKPISDEERTAFNAEIASIKTSITALQGEMLAATTALTEATTAQGTMAAEITQLKADLVNKQKLAAGGAASAAELAAAQTVPPVGATTDVDANGKTPEQKLQAQLSAEKDPKKKGEICAQLRAIRKLDFAAQYEQAHKS